MSLACACQCVSGRSFYWILFAHAVSACRFLPCQHFFVGGVLSLHDGPPVLSHSVMCLWGGGYQVNLNECSEFALFGFTSVGQSGREWSKSTTYCLKATSQNDRQDYSQERLELYSPVRRPRLISTSVGYRFSHIGSSLLKFALRLPLAFYFLHFFFQRIRFHNEALVISP